VGSLSHAQNSHARFTCWQVSFIRIVSLKQEGVNSFQMFFQSFEDMKKVKEESQRIKEKKIEINFS